MNKQLNFTKNYILGNRYSLITYVKLIIWAIRTKLIWRKARIIRFPFDLRGKKYISASEGLTTGVGCRLEAYPEGGKYSFAYRQKCANERLCSHYGYE